MDEGIGKKPSGLMRPSVPAPPPSTTLISANATQRCALTSTAVTHAMTETYAGHTAEGDGGIGILSETANLLHSSGDSRALFRSSNSFHSLFSVPETCSNSAVAGASSVERDCTTLPHNDVPLTPPPSPPKPILLSVPVPLQPAFASAEDSADSGCVHPRHAWPEELFAGSGAMRLPRFLRSCEEAPVAAALNGHGRGQPLHSAVSRHGFGSVWDSGGEDSGGGVGGNQPSHMTPLPRVYPASTLANKRSRLEAVYESTCTETVLCPPEGSMMTGAEAETTTTADTTTTTTTTTLTSAAQPTATTVSAASKTAPAHFHVSVSRDRAAHTIVSRSVCDGESGDDGRGGGGEWPYSGDVDLSHSPQRADSHTAAPPAEAEDAEDAEDNVDANGARVETLLAALHTHLNRSLGQLSSTPETPDSHAVVCTLLATEELLAELCVAIGIPFYEKIAAKDANHSHHSRHHHHHRHMSCNSERGWSGKHESPAASTINTSVTGLSDGSHTTASLHSQKGSPYQPLSSRWAAVLSSAMHAASSCSLPSPSPPRELLRVYAPLYRLLATRPVAEQQWGATATSTAATPKDEGAPNRSGPLGFASVLAAALTLLHAQAHQNPSPLPPHSFTHPPGSPSSSVTEAAASTVNSASHALLAIGQVTAWAEAAWLPTLCQTAGVLDLLALALATGTQAQRCRTPVEDTSLAVVHHASLRKCALQVLTRFALSHLPSPRNTVDAHESSANSRDASGIVVKQHKGSADTATASGPGPTGQPQPPPLRDSLVVMCERGFVELVARQLTLPSSPHLAAVTTTTKRGVAVLSTPLTSSSSSSLCAVARTPPHTLAHTAMGGRKRAAMATWGPRIHRRDGHNECHGEGMNRDDDSNDDPHAADSVCRFALDFLNAVCRPPCDAALVASKAVAVGLRAVLARSLRAPKREQCGVYPARNLAPRSISRVALHATPPRSPGHPSQNECAMSSPASSDTYASDEARYPQDYPHSRELLYSAVRCLDRGFKDMNSTSTAESGVGMLLRTGVIATAVHVLRRVSDGGAALADHKATTALLRVFSSLAASCTKASAPLPTLSALEDENPPSSCNVAERFLQTEGLLDALVCGLTWEADSVAAKESIRASLHAVTAVIACLQHMHTVRRGFTVVNGEGDDRTVSDADSGAHCCLESDTIRLLKDRGLLFITLMWLSGSAEQVGSGTSSGSGSSAIAGGTAPSSSSSSVGGVSGRNKSDCSCGGGAPMPTAIVAAPTVTVEPGAIVRSESCSSSLLVSSSSTLAPVVGDRAGSFHSSGGAIVNPIRTSDNPGSKSTGNGTMTATTDGAGTTATASTDCGRSLATRFAHSRLVARCARRSAESRNSTASGALFGGGFGSSSISSGGLLDVWGRPLTAAAMARALVMTPIQREAAELLYALTSCALSLMSGSDHVDVSARATRRRPRKVNGCGVVTRHSGGGHPAAAVAAATVGAEVLSYLAANMDVIVRFLRRFTLDGCRGMPARVPTTNATSAAVATNVVPRFAGSIVSTSTELKRLELRAVTVTLQSLGHTLEHALAKSSERSCGCSGDEAMHDGAKSTKGSASLTTTSSAVADATEMCLSLIQCSRLLPLLATLGTRTAIAESGEVLMSAALATLESVMLAGSLRESDRVALLLSLPIVSSTTTTMATTGKMARNGAAVAPTAIPTASVAPTAVRSMGVASRANSPPPLQQQQQQDSWARVMAICTALDSNVSISREWSTTLTASTLPLATRTVSSSTLPSPGVVGARPEQQQQPLLSLYRQQRYHRDGHADCQHDDNGREDGPLLSPCQQSTSRGAARSGESGERNRGDDVEDQQQQQRRQRVRLCPQSNVSASTSAAGGTVASRVAAKETSSRGTPPPAPVGTTKTLLAILLDALRSEDARTTPLNAEAGTATAAAAWPLHKMRVLALLTRLLRRPRSRGPVTLIADPTTPNGPVQSASRVLSTHPLLDPSVADVLLFSGVSAAIVAELQMAAVRASPPRAVTACLGFLQALLSRLPLTVPTKLLRPAQQRAVSSRAPVSAAHGTAAAVSVAPEAIADLLVAVRDGLAQRVRARLQRLLALRIGSTLLHLINEGPTRRWLPVMSASPTGAAAAGAGIATPGATVSVSTRPASSPQITPVVRLTPPSTALRVSVSPTATSTSAAGDICRPPASTPPPHSTARSTGNSAESSPEDVPMTVTLHRYSSSRGTPSCATAVTAAAAAVPVAATRVQATCAHVNTSTGVNASGGSGNRMANSSGILVAHRDDGGDSDDGVRAVIVRAAALEVSLASTTAAAASHTATAGPNSVPLSRGTSAAAAAVPATADVSMTSEAAAETSATAVETRVTQAMTTAPRAALITHHTLPHASRDFCLTAVRAVDAQPGSRAFSSSSSDAANSLSVCEIVATLASAPGATVTSRCVQATGDSGSSGTCSNTPQRGASTLPAGCIMPPPRMQGNNGTNGRTEEVQDRSGEETVHLITITAPNAQCRRAMGPIISPRCGNTSSGAGSAAGQVEGRPPSASRDAAGPSLTVSVAMQEPLMPTNAFAPSSSAPSPRPADTATAVPSPATLSATAGNATSAPVPDLSSTNTAARSAACSPIRVTVASAATAVLAASSSSILAPTIGTSPSVREATISTATPAVVAVRIQRRPLAVGCDLSGGANGAASAGGGGAGAAHTLSPPRELTVAATIEASPTSDQESSIRSSDSAADRDGSTGRSATAPSLPPGSSNPAIPVMHTASRCSSSGSGNSRGSSRNDHMAARPSGSFVAAHTVSASNTAPPTTAAAGDHMNPWIPSLMHTSPHQMKGASNVRHSAGGVCVSASMRDAQRARDTWTPEARRSVFASAAATLALLYRRWHDQHECQRSCYRGRSGEIWENDRELDDGGPGSSSSSGSDDSEEEEEARSLRSTRTGRRTHTEVFNTGGRSLSPPRRERRSLHQQQRRRRAHVPRFAAVASPGERVLHLDTDPRTDASAADAATTAAALLASAGGCAGRPPSSVESLPIHGSHVFLIRHHMGVDGDVRVTATTQTPVTNTPASLAGPVRWSQTEAVLSGRQAMLAERVRVARPAPPTPSAPSGLAASRTNSEGNSDVGRSENPVAVAPASPSSAAATRSSHVLRMVNRNSANGGWRHPALQGLPRSPEEIDEVVRRLRVQGLSEYLGTSHNDDSSIREAVRRCCSSVRARSREDATGHRVRPKQPAGVVTAAARLRAEQQYRSGMKSALEALVYGGSLTPVSVPSVMAASAAARTIPEGARGKISASPPTAHVSSYSAPHSATPDTEATRAVAFLLKTAKQLTQTD